jgi:hypothetical protein
MDYRYLNYLKTNGFEPAFDPHNIFGTQDRSIICSDMRKFIDVCKENHKEKMKNNGQPFKSLAEINEEYLEKHHMENLQDALIKENVKFTGEFNAPVTDKIPCSFNDQVDELKKKRNELSNEVHAVNVELSQLYLNRYDLKGKFLACLEYGYIYVESVFLGDNDKNERIYVIRGMGFRGGNGIIDFSTNKIWEIPVDEMEDWIDDVQFVDKTIFVSRLTELMQETTNAVFEKLLAENTNELK